MSICLDFFQGSPVDKSWQFRELLQIPHQIWCRTLRFVKLPCVSLSCQKHLVLAVLAAFFLTFHMGLVTKKRAIDLVRSWECEKGWELGPTCQQVGIFGGNLANSFKVLVASPHHWKVLAAGTSKVGKKNIPPEKKHHQSNVLVRRSWGLSSCVQWGFWNPHCVWNGDSDGWWIRFFSKGNPEMLVYFLESTRLQQSLVKWQLEFMQRERHF